ncbi:hypothetical protein HanOQP8_Chr05g0179971 [Helianthus annuus]|nr:hypothetical protein HanIR_Chr05g0222471 [Helianthus annuus]KAJ0746615.1 hypothetical protein HanOQP8_Chr05g0179971 [Helianthus annuus]
MACDLDGGGQQQHRRSSRPPTTLIWRKKVVFRVVIDASGGPTGKISVAVTSYSVVMAAVCMVQRCVRIVSLIDLWFRHETLDNSGFISPFGFVFQICILIDRFV